MTKAQDPTPINAQVPEGLGIPTLDAIMPERKRSPGKQPVIGLQYDKARGEFETKVYPTVVKLGQELDDAKAAQEAAERENRELTDTIRQMAETADDKKRRAAEGVKMWQMRIKVLTDIRGFTGAEITPESPLLSGESGRYRDTLGFTYNFGGDSLGFRHTTCMDSESVLLRWSDIAAPMGSPAWNQLTGFILRCVDNPSALPRLMPDRFARRMKTSRRDVQSALEDIFPGAIVEQFAGNNRDFLSFLQSGFGER